METILDRLADYAKLRVSTDKKAISLEQIKSMCSELMAKKKEREHFCFEKKLRRQGLSFICEVKKASPSKGIISNDFPYLEIAKEYEEAGADCISCLTEPKWFLGSDQIFSEIRATVQIPMIRKDFTVDEYQIYQAKLMGADAVLLILAILTQNQLQEYLSICETLGLTALVEAHNEAELTMAIAAGAKVLGVNNRNLKDFSIDTENSRRLRKLVPKNIIFVSESGIRSPEDIHALREIGVDAVLIGEAFMRAENKKAMLAMMRKEEFLSQK